MSRACLILITGVAFSIVGCGSTAPIAAPTLHAEEASAWDQQRAEHNSPRALRRRGTATSRQRQHVQRENRARPARGRGGPVDVRFDRAELGNALRFLADAARLGLVIEEGVHGEVTLTLSRVRPLDALIALAEAHGARARLRDNVVVVSAR